MATEIADQDESDRLQLEIVFTTWRGFIAATLERMASDGQLREPIDSRRLAVAILAALRRPDDQRIRGQ
jgi:hypothetical protein